MSKANDEYQCSGCQFADFEDMDSPLCWYLSIPVPMPKTRCSAYKMDQALKDIIYGPVDKTDD